MEAVILAGGFGTRLAHVVQDVPKPMAPVCGKPFLQHLLDDLCAKGVQRVILAVGYKAECIESFFKNEYRGMELIYSREDTPLLTGGALKKALSICREKEIFLFNGDTFFDVDLQAMARLHQEKGALLTIAVKQMRDFERYGTVEIDPQGRIVRFVEKRPCREGAINGGVYLIKRDALGEIAADKFSFETEYLEKKVSGGQFYAFASDGYFIDIGVPQDYAKAQEDFKNR